MKPGPSGTYANGNAITRKGQVLPNRFEHLFADYETYQYSQVIFVCKQTWNGYV